MQKLFENKILTATLSCLSQNTKYPVENLKDTRLAKFYRTLGNSAEWVKISTAITASRFAIMGHNLLSGAVLRVQGNNTDTWTAPSFNELITWKQGIIIHKFTESTFNYWRLLMTDSARSYISIGGLFLGTYLQGPNLKPDAGIDDATTSDNDSSASGQLYGNEGYDFRSFKINYANMSDSMRAEMREWWNSCRNVKPFILIPWANREDIEPPVYCYADQESIPWKRTGSEKAPWSTSIAYKECF